MGEWVKHTKAIILLKENPITKTSVLGTYYVVVCIRKDLEVGTRAIRNSDLE